MLGYITRVRYKYENLKKTIIPTKRVAVEIVHEFTYMNEEFFVCEAPDYHADKGYIAIHKNTGLMSSNPIQESQKNIRVTTNAKSYKTPKEAEKRTIQNINEYIASGKNFSELIEKHKKSVTFKKPTSSFIELRVRKIIK